MDEEEGDEGDAWVDYDYTPAPRNYSKCPKCSDDYVLRHHCKPTSPLRTWITGLVRPHA
jgi:hypothetical protein